MARNITFAIEEYYHVFNRGVDKRTVFLDQRDYERFIGLLYLCNAEVTLHRSDYLITDLHHLLHINRDGTTLVNIGAYCLMPNHFHILFREKTDGGLSRFMQKLCTAYTMYFNKRYERTGALFSSRFKAVHVTRDEHLRNLYSYIHLNPVELVYPNWKESSTHIPTKKAQAFLENYPHSSYLDYSEHTRPESAILNQTAFPQYFQTSYEFRELLDFWLTYPYVKVEP